MKDIAKEIQELRDMPTAALVDRYRDLWGKSPRSKSREFLWKRCAWKLQEQRLGGLSRTAKKKLEELISEIQLPGLENRRTVKGTLKKTTRPGELPAGTVISREYRGHQVHLKVVEGGFELDGVVYKSLSAAAEGLTGSHWNGRLFWGLKGRKRP